MGLGSNYVIHQSEKHKAKSVEACLSATLDSKHETLMTQWPSKHNSTAVVRSKSKVGVQ